MSASSRPLAALLLILAVGLSGCIDRDLGPGPPPGEILPPDWVAVRLEVPESGVDVACEGPWRLVDRRGNELRSGGRLGAGTRVEAAVSGVVLGGLRLDTPVVELQATGTARLALSGRSYRGVLRFSATGPGVLAVTNRLDVDSYLRGVLPGEMPDRFGLEALKAQAVAARTYALSEMASRGFLYPDVRSQVYGGRSVETTAADRAVADTAGQVLTVGGRVFPAWFHSTCGGATAPASSLYTHPPVGVMEVSSVCPDCTLSPTYSWTRRVPAERVCAAVDLPVAPLTEVRCDPARFPGRPERITVSAGGRSATVSMTDFRARVSAGVAFGEQLLSTRCASAPRIEAGDLVIDGHGWGHGIGLCQYGAAGYAARGASYQLILRRYYVGATLVQLR